MGAQLSTFSSLVLLGFAADPQSVKAHKFDAFIAVGDGEDEKETKEFEMMAKKYEKELLKVNDGGLVYQKRIADMNPKDYSAAEGGVWIYIGHGHNTGKSPLPVLSYKRGAGFITADKVVELHASKGTTLIFNCCNWIKEGAKESPWPGLKAPTGKHNPFHNATIVYARPGSVMKAPELATQGQMVRSSVFLNKFVKQLKNRQTPQEAAVEATALVERWRANGMLNADNASRFWDSRNTSVRDDNPNLKDLEPLDGDVKAAFPGNTSISTISVQLAIDDVLVTIAS